MELNLKKCKEIVIDFRRNKTIIPPLVINGSWTWKSPILEIAWIMGRCHDDLKWKSNVEYLVKKAAKRLFLWKVLKSYNAPTQDFRVFYIYIIRSTLEYCAQLWHGNLTTEQSHDLERIQKRAIRVIYPEVTYEEALLKCNLDTLEFRREDMCINLIQSLCLIQIINYILYYLFTQQSRGR